MQNRYLTSFCFILLLIINVSFIVTAQITEKFSEPPVNTDGSSVLKCAINSCVSSLTTNEEGSNDGYYVVLSRSSNELIAKWNKPRGNLLISNLTLSFVMKGCDSIISNCSVQPYPVEVYVWNNYKWLLLSKESLLNTENTYSYSVTDKIKSDDGQYIAKIINKGIAPSDYVFIDQATLTMYYENLDKAQETHVRTFLNFFKDNVLFWQRIGTGIGVFTLVLVLIFTLRKNKKIKSFFKFNKNAAKEDKEFNTKLEEYKEFKNRLEDMNLKLRAIEESRKETQKKYYRRQLDENTFKQIMRTYEQDRIELINEISEIKKILGRYS